MNSSYSLTILYAYAGLQTMKTNHPKLKPPPRPLFSCAFFRHCAQTSLSPTTPTPPPLPPSPPPAPPPPKKLSSSSSSSSSSASHSFTQWKFPLPSSPPPPPTQQPQPTPHPLSSSPPSNNDNPQDIFRTAELHLTSNNPQTQLSALHLLERTLLLPNSTSRSLGDGDQPSATCPTSLMRAIVAFLKTNATPYARKSATKILLSLCLAEPNRRVAVEAGAAGAVVEGAMELAEEGAAAERALAALELMCTVKEGADEVTGHALAVPAMVGVMGRVEGRGREHAMGVLAVVFSAGRKEDEEGGEVVEEVAKAVELALKGECSERGRRKGKQLLKILADISQFSNKKQSPRQLDQK